MMTDEQIDTMLSTWSRGPEVRVYAARRNITLQVALNQLVNSGLSHAPRYL